MPQIIVRHADLDGPDAAAVGRLIGTYLLQTEHEKCEHLGGGSPAISAAHEREAADPGGVHAGSAVLLAEVDGVPSGVVVVRTSACELKRFWTVPEARGLGVGTALLDAAIELCDGDARLSVWEWRAPALRLYESRGFVRVDSWEDRAGLVCMIRAV